MCEDMGNTLPVPSDGEAHALENPNRERNNAQNSLPSPVSQMPTSANSRVAAASAARPSKWLNRDEMDDRPKNSPKRTPQRRNRVSVPCGDDHLASVGFLLSGNFRTRQKPQQRQPVSFATNAPKRTWQTLYKSRNGAVQFPKKQHKTHITTRCALERQISKDTT